MGIAYLSNLRDTAIGLPMVITLGASDVTLDGVGMLFMYPLSAFPTVKMMHNWE